jgi:hypothetical protein
VGILDSVQGYDHPGFFGKIAQAGILLRGPKGNYALVGGSLREFVEGVALFKSKSDFSVTAKVDDFLDPRTTGAAYDQHPFHRSSRE